MSTKVVNRMPQFKSALNRALDDALSELSTDILTQAKNRAPYSGTIAIRKKAGLKGASKTAGQLRASGITQKDGHLSHEVRFGGEDVNYARYQEFGGGNGKVIRKYTTPDTGKSYLGDSGDDHAKRFVSVIKKHTARIYI